MNDAVKEIITNWGFAISGITMFALGLINAFVRKYGTRTGQIIWPKIALIMIAVFLLLLGSVYFDKRPFVMSDFFSVIFFWNVLPYFSGIGIFAWVKREFWES